MHIRFNFIHRDIKPENVLLTCPALKVTAKKKEVWKQKDFAEAV